MRHKDVKSKHDEKRLYDIARELSRKIKQPFLEPIIRVSLTDAAGVRKQVFERHSRSYTRNMYDNFMWTMEGLKDIAGGYADGYCQVKRTSGAIDDTDLIHWGPSNMDGATGMMGGGIYVGTGVTPENIDDYIIESMIADGAGAGELEQGLMGLWEGWNGGDNYYYRGYKRTFTNASGNTINVTESVVNKIVGTIPFCMLRDVFGAIGVLIGETLELEYEFRLTYP